MDTRSRRISGRGRRGGGGDISPINTSKRRFRGRVRERVGREGWEP